MKKHFINLTNGLEWIDEIPHYSFVRVESTAIEKNDWNRVLRDLDANFLMSLSLGHECHFYDCGANRQTSKTVSIAIPFITKTLSSLWFDSKMPALTKEEQAIKRKLNYFKRFLNTKQIHLIGHSKLTRNDSNKPYYRDLVTIHHKFYEIR